MRVGNYQIPTSRLFPRLAEAIRLIYENYRLEVADNPEAAAKLCGHKSANSGTWLYKLADMRNFGLLEKRTIKATKLAEKFTYGTLAEKEKAINTAILNIPLWQELYSKYGVELPKSNFWVQLQKITGLDPLEAQKHADSVRKAYLADIRYYKPEKEDIDGDDEVDNDAIDTKIAIPIGLEEFRFGDIRIWLPKEGTQEAWDKTKKMLDIYLGMKEEG